MRCLLEGDALLDGDAYSDITVNRAALIRRQPFFEARCFLEEAQYLIERIISLYFFCFSYYFNCGMLGFILPLFSFLF